MISVGEKFLWQPTPDWMVLMEIISVDKEEESRIKWETYVVGTISRPVSGEITWSLAHYNAAIKLPYIAPHFDWFAVENVCSYCMGKRYKADDGLNIVLCTYCNGTGCVSNKTKVKYKDSIMHPTIELDT